MLQAAKVQRWAPEELLRTLVEAEIAARDASNARARLRPAGFPVTKTLAEFNVGLSSVPQGTWDYLASLEWIRAAENLCLVGPAGTGKSHALIALGHAAVADGMRCATSPPPISSKRPIRASRSSSAAYLPSGGPPACGSSRPR